MNAAVSARSGGSPASQPSRIAREFRAFRAFSHVDVTIDAGDVGGLTRNPEGVEFFDVQ